MSQHHPEVLPPPQDQPKPTWRRHQCQPNTLSPSAAQITLPCCCLGEKICRFSLVLGSLLDVMVERCWICLPVKQKLEFCAESFPNPLLQHLPSSGLRWFLVPVPFPSAGSCWCPQPHPWQHLGGMGMVFPKQFLLLRYALHIPVWPRAQPFIFPLHRRVWSCGWPLLFKIKKPGGSFVLCRLKIRASVLCWVETAGIFPTWIFIWLGLKERGKQGKKKTRTLQKDGLSCSRWWKCCGSG